MQRLARREAEPLSLCLVDRRLGALPGRREPAVEIVEQPEQPGLVELVEGQGEDEVIAIAERAGCLVAQVRELAHEGRGAGPDRLRGVPGLAPELAVRRLAQDLRDLVVVDVAPADSAPVAREQRAQTSLRLDDAIRQGALALGGLAGQTRQAHAARELRIAAPTPVGLDELRVAIRLGKHRIDLLRRLDELLLVLVAGIDRRIPIRQAPRVYQGLEGLLEVVHRRLHGLHTENLDDRPAPPQGVTHRAGKLSERSQGVHRAPRCTNGSPARQRSRKRPIGGCSGSSASSSRRTTRTSRTAGSLDGRSSGASGSGIA